MKDGWYYIKTWEQMDEWFGLTQTGSINCLPSFTQEMEKYIPPHRCIEIKNDLWRSFNINQVMIASPCYAIGDKVMVRNDAYKTWHGPYPYEGYNYGMDKNHMANNLYWDLCKRYEPPKIEITCTINGKPVKLSEISEETLLKIRSEN